jgi:hypothetical protein
MRVAKQQVELECVACKAMFKASREDALTCSPKCRKAWSRWKQSLRKPMQFTTKQLATFRPIPSEMTTTDTPPE